MEKNMYWLGWQLIMPGVGRRVWDIINYFGSPEAAWYAGKKEFTKVPGIKPEAAEKIVQKRSRLNLEKELDYLYHHKVDFITYDDDNYPPALRDIFDPPPVLFVRGRLKELNNAVAVVGSRKATAYGRTAAQRLAGELAENGAAVVSGLARGIDSAAHRGALNAGGYTAAVLGCGLDVVYPKENARLMAEIIEKGAVISEFPLGSPPESWHFPSRNRIISGLSQVVVVVEAAEKSGALITADLALEQGKEVMALPGSIYSKMSRGPLKLIKQGAKPVTAAEDILEELGIISAITGEQAGSQFKFKLSRTEQAVYDILSGDPLHIEELLQRLQLPSQEVMAALMFLEVKGLLKKMPGKMYAAVNSR